MSDVSFDLGDRRLNARAKKCLERLYENPGLSLPKAFVDSSELEGFYRFLHNKSVSDEGLMEAVKRGAFESMGTQEEQEALVLHDTSLIKPPSSKTETIEEFRELKGFSLHLSFASRGRFEKDFWARW